MKLWKWEITKETVTRFFTETVSKISAETLGWLAAVVIHCATVPTLLAMLTGLSDSAPSLDVVGFVWGGLVLLFFRAIVLRDMLNIITIGIGFMVQAGLMALILFK